MAFGDSDEVRKQRIQPSFYDVNYPLASATITNGGVLITSTGADYFGYAILSTSAGATVRIYDNTASGGKLIDVFVVVSNTSQAKSLVVPVRARIGLYAQITNGTGAEGVIMFAPKG